VRASKSIAPTFRTSALDRISGQLHVPAAPPAGQAPPTHFTEGSVDPRNRLGLKEKKITYSSQALKTSLPALSQLLYRLSYRDSLTFITVSMKFCTGVNFCNKYNLNIALVWAKTVTLRLNRTYYLLVLYADDMSLMGNNIDIIMKAQKFQLLLVWRLVQK
jgi:hypothetical protein